MTEQPDDRDLTAAAYVVGVLEPAEASAFEQQADHDAALEQTIDKWRYRLAPLATAVRPVPPPPNLWRRIEITLGFASIPVVTEATAQPRPERVATDDRLRRRVRFWRAATAAALACAIAGIAFAYSERQTPPLFATFLAAPDTPKPAFVVQLEAGNVLVVRPLQAISVQPGRDLELWAVADGKAPKSLGLLPAIGRRMNIPSVRSPDMQLLVSLEPAGGSTTGMPTGPVLYSGTLEHLE
jgi:anti-sigma-K factor RskA